MLHATCDSGMRCQKIYMENQPGHRIRNTCIIFEIRTLKTLTMMTAFSNHKTACCIKMMYVNSLVVNNSKHPRALLAYVRLTAWMLLPFKLGRVEFYISLVMNEKFVFGKLPVISGEIVIKLFNKLWCNRKPDVFVACSRRSNKRNGSDKRENF